MGCANSWRGCARPRQRGRAMREDARSDAAPVLQVSIVLASAGIITGTIAPAWVAGALGMAEAALSTAIYFGMV